MDSDRLYHMTTTEVNLAKANAAIRMACVRARREPLLDAFPPGAMFRDLVETWQRDQLLGKAAVGGIGSGLLPPTLTRPLLAIATPTAILPRLAAERVPFDVPVPAETAPMVAHWVAAGAAKPLTKGAFDTVTLTRGKIAAPIVVSNELLKLGGDTVETWLRQRLAHAVAVGIDTTFLSPTDPRSILNGVTPTTGTGTPAGDLAALLAAFTGSVEHAVLIMSSRNAVAASLSGDPFSTLTRTGGTAGVPVVAADSAGDVLALVDTYRLLVADEGELAVRSSTETSLEMDDAPIGSSLTPTGATTMVSMYQTNSTALMAERYVGWQALDGAVQWIDNVAYGAPGA